MKKQLLALLTLTALLLALAPAAALAAEPFTIQNGVLTKYNDPNGGAVTIPAGVTRIGERAFFNSAVTSVTIPEGVTAIDKEAFSNCSKLTAVILPGSLTALGDSAFKNCPQLKDATLPYALTTIGKEAFLNCSNLSSVAIPDSVTSLGESAFAQCSRMINLTLGAGLTEISKMAFSHVNITSLTIPGNVAAIGEGAFSNAERLAELTLSEGLVTIGKSAFAGDKSLGTVVIPNSTRNIGDEAFARCGGLTSITIPSTVTNMGANILTAASSGLKVYGVPGSKTENLAKATYGATFVAMEETVLDSIAYASTQDVLIDSTTVRLEAYALKDASGNSTNYVKIRDVAVYLDNTAAQFNVGWDGAVNIETGKIYSSKNGQENHTPYYGNQPYHANTADTKVNGKVVALDSFIILDNSGKGSTYYKLRDLGQALNFNVGWAADKGIYIETGKPYDPAN